MRNLKEQVKKTFSDLSLFEYIVLVISNILQILGLEPQKKGFILALLLGQFVLTVGQNNSGNKILFLRNM